MLNCTTVNGVSVLFYDGNVQCLQGWQYAVLTLVCVFIFPFFLVLLFGPRLLQKRRIGISFFMLAFLFPLFLAGPIVYMFVNEYHKDRADIHDRQKEAKRRQRADMTAHREHAPSASPPPSTARTFDSASTVDSEPDAKTTCFGEPELEMTELLVDVIFGPYGTGDSIDPLDYRRQRVNMYGLCWEGVINLRRLILVTLFTFINDVLTKQIMLTLACFVFLLIHLKVKPFKHMLSNVIESVTLSLLLNISITNLVKAAFYNSQTIPRDIGYIVMVAFEWVEVVSLLILPLFIIAMLLFSIVVRGVGSIIEGRRNRSEGGGADPPTYSSDAFTRLSGGIVAAGGFRPRRDIGQATAASALPTTPTRRMIRYMSGATSGARGRADLENSSGSGASLPRTAITSPWVPEYSDRSSGLTSRSNHRSRVAKSGGETLQPSLPRIQRY